jgi:hypothetical protein
VGYGGSNRKFLGLPGRPATDLAAVTLRQRPGTRHLDGVDLERRTHMGETDLVERPGTTRRLLAFAFVSLVVVCVALLVAGRAEAGSLTGGFSPTIVGGGADVDGNGVVNVSDDANAFYGDTSIIDGKLDCDGWG